MTNLHWFDAVKIARAVGLLGASTWYFLGGYYALTLVSTVFEGIGFIMLVSAVTGPASAGQNDDISRALLQFLQHQFGIPPSITVIVIVVAALFSARTLISSLLIVADGWMGAYVRQSLQVDTFRRILETPWEVSKNFRVGQLVGTLTEEAATVARYLIASIKVVYHIIATLTFGLIALYVSTELTLLLSVLGLPLVLVLRTVFKFQSAWASSQTKARQNFAADTTERLNHLYHIKVEGSGQSHFRFGVRHQAAMSQYEKLIGCSQAFVSNFSQIAMVFALIGICLLARLKDLPLQDMLHVFAGVGVIGTKAVAQLNNAIAAYGTLSRLGGSIEPLVSIFSLAHEKERRPIHERVTAVQGTDLVYSHDESTLLDVRSIHAAIADPLVLQGPSGSGKTTMANILSGLIPAQQGEVVYLGSGGKYDAQNFRAKIGYITQDVSLFHGSVRANLSLEQQCEVSDEMLWDALHLAGAYDFVLKIGGLDGQVVEGGRSLSGGERRRLGIARMLASNPDVLILDEITNGLDVTLRRDIVATIRQIAESRVVIVITHDPDDYTGWRQWQPNQGSSHQ